MLLKGVMVAEAFYPFVENGGGDEGPDATTLEVRHPARIAIFDDAAAAPRVVVVEPTDIRSYLEEITATVTRLAQQQGGRIPFTVVREVVENLIHAYFIEPTVSILDEGNTIRFSDQGPGIHDKGLALEYGTTSATTEMKRYIRGVGSGLPYAQQWLEEKGGSLTVEDNIHSGTVVTVSLVHGPPRAASHAWGELAHTGMLTSQPHSSAYQQPWGQQGPVMQTYPSPYQPPHAPGGQAVGWQATPVPQAAPDVSERGRLVLEYLRSHEEVGPRDLNAWRPLSESTWSRELTSLEKQGLVSKQGGQKRRLTAMGRQFLGMWP